MNNVVCLVPAEKSLFLLKTKDLMWQQKKKIVCVGVMGGTYPGMVHLFSYNDSQKEGFTPHNYAQ